MSSRGQRGGGAQGNDRSSRGAGGGPPGRGGMGPTPPSFQRGRGGAAQPSPPFHGGPHSRGAPPSRGEGFRGGPPRGRGGPIIFAENSPANIPSRLTETSHNELINSFKSLKVSVDRPLRPGFGTAGTSFTVRANFFPLKKLPEGPIYDYTIDISPKVEGGVRRRLFELMELNPMCTPHMAYIAHDRTQRLVSARKLPQPFDIQVPLYDEPATGPNANSKIYTMSIIFLRELQINQLKQYLNGKPAARDDDIAPLSSAFELILQQHASRTGIRVGKNRYFFLEPANRISLGPWVDAYPGFYMSARPAFKELMVNVNVCMTAFVKPGNLADALLDFSRNSSGAMPRLPIGFGRVKVKTRHQGYTKSIQGVGVTSARNTTFDGPDGQMTVEQYFQKQYGIKLKYPTELPVVNTSGPNKNPTWLPAELCDILPGHPYAPLDDKEVAQMIRYALQPPRVNAEAIVNRGFPTLGLSPILPPISGFGISVDTEMAVVPARELRPPRLNYKSGNANVKDGSWNILDVTFHRGARVTSWWVVVVRDGFRILDGPTDPKLQQLVEGFANKCRRSGMILPEGRPRLIPVNLPPERGDLMRTNAINMLRTTFKATIDNGKKPSFVLVLLEKRDNFIYPAIKRIGDVELGIHTIHMQLNKALTDQKKQDQYFSNVALKANTKLGGINHLLDDAAMRWLTQKKTMMVGIDVTHPGLKSREGAPSIAALVASVDDSFVQFPATLRIQSGTEEMVQQLDDMLIERLQAYEKKNKVLPERIFVFRDGVSEGQFDLVNAKELPQFLNAFKRFGTKLRKPYKPKLSIVICGKRHHARFYPVNSAFADRNGNTRPGTVVDKGVTAVFDFDFYLQAHAGLQGTVKATHYTVVYDENDFSADDIQQGTNNFSHLYARATKAVSLIPPAYYADLACERGRYYLNEIMNLTNNARTSGRMKRLTDEEKKRALKAAQDAWGKGLHEDMRESMFYI